MKRLLVGCITLFALGSLAQTAPAADIEQVWLDPAGRGSLLVGNGQTLKQLEFRAGVSGHYVYSALRGAGDAKALVSDRLGLQVFGALGILDWLQLGINVPVQAYQLGSDSLNLASAGLGNPWVHAKFMVLGQRAPLQLAVDLGVGIPVGTAVAQGNGGFEFAPRVQVGKVFDVFQLGGEVGFLYRPLTDYATITGDATTRVGSMLWVAGTITTVNASGPRGEFTLRGNFSLAGADHGVEGQLGVRWPVGPVELFASAGPGFGGAPNNPTLRTYFGLAFANTPLTQPPCDEATDYDVATCPDLDKDHDGVKNAADGAPREPEDKDGFQDEDGVPDPDNDGDGVLDAADRCPLKKGLVENDGCPDVDADGDGLVDRLDRCPSEKEDLDGFEDADGCPDPDNDQDGIADADDKCPIEKGLRRDQGCPAKDGDGDGLVDAEDNCPTEPGPATNSGCPAEKKQLVQISGSSLKILDKVYFDTGKAKIQKRSFTLLDNVAQVLATHAEIAHVQIEGHTDNTGNADKNKRLSQERADAVKTYLTTKGIDAGRLSAVGFGQEKPAQPNDTPAGREANRRVEFNILEQ